jgi:hypothetical protein
MNKRLQELLLQAGVDLRAQRPYLDEDPTGYLESDRDYMLNNRLAILTLLEQGGLEKFAELIVRECAGIAETHVRAKNNALVEHVEISPWQLQDEIKEHFGVEP